MGDKNIENASEEAGRVIENIDTALNRLKETSQGRVYTVGTAVTFRGKYGVVTYLHQGSEDPLASTVNIRLADGTTFEKVPVESATLQLFRS